MTVVVEPVKQLNLAGPYPAMDVVLYRVKQVELVCDDDVRVGVHDTADNAVPTTTVPNKEDELSHACHLIQCEVAEVRGERRGQVIRRCDVGGVGGVI